MIQSLDDAWQWYQSARNATMTLQRLSDKHWQRLPLEDFARDERFKTLDPLEISSWSQSVLGDLDDLCVLLLFSVFEASIRELALTQIDDELPAISHPRILHAIETLRESTMSGSFFRVLEPYKSLDADLVEEVNQVRRYRNWVAHGRRGAQPASVSPSAAHERLRRFLHQFPA